MDRDKLYDRYPALVTCIEGGVLAFGTVRESAAIELSELDARVAELEAHVRAAIGEVADALAEMREAQWIAPPGFAAEGRMKNARGVLEAALKGGG